MIPYSTIYSNENKTVCTWNKLYKLHMNYKCKSYLLNSDQNMSKRSQNFIHLGEIIKIHGTKNYAHILLDKNYLTRIQICSSRTKGLYYLAKIMQNLWNEVWLQVYINYRTKHIHLRNKSLYTCNNKIEKMEQINIIIDHILN